MRITECDLLKLAFNRNVSVDLLGAATRHGNPIATWDDGSGPLWLYSESIDATCGIVRADTWEDAWECVVDEIMSDADPDDPDAYASSYDESADPDELAEGCHYRGGTPANPALTSTIARGDLNGERLVLLTQAMVDELGISLDVAVNR